MSFLKNWKNKITPGTMFVIVAAGSLIARLIYLLVPIRPSWDGSVYLGMASYIAHNGHIGVWEQFRPVLWPLMLAPFSLGSPVVLEVSAYVFLIIFSMIALYCLYKAGEKAGAYVGVGAALLLSFSSPFFAYAHTPMTEVIEVLAVAATLWLFVQGRMFWLGIGIGLAFTARFPLGLLLPVAGLALLISESPTAWTSWNGFKNLVVKGLHICLGFAIPAGLYFAFNMYFYGDAFSVLSEASGMITGFLWLYKGTGLFYIVEIVNHNLWVLWMLPGMIFAFINCIREKGFGSQKGKVFIFSFLCMLIFLIYFSIQPHKEFRYAIMVMPAVAFLSAYGFVEMLKQEKLKYIALILGGMTLLWMACNMHFFQNEKIEVKEYASFYSGLLGAHDATVITATPIIASYSKVSMIVAYNSWEQFGDAYHQERSRAQYVAYDTCELHVCTPGQENQCKTREDSVRAEIASREEIIFQKTVNACTLVIARINK
jgi:4-amino-4-deoxy-L-arabinose transferase-like glycosyltransferase